MLSRTIGLRRHRGALAHVIRTKFALLAIALVVPLWATHVSAQVVFTGDAPLDFAGAAGAGLLPDSVDDVGGPFTEIGWDLRGLHFHYDEASDTLSLGFDHVWIAGDADGDGDPNTTSTELSDFGGTDEVDLGGRESIAIAFDVDGGGFDFIAGVPGGDPDVGEGPGCSDFDYDDCFAVFEAAGADPGSLAFRFGPWLAPVSPGPRPSAAAPDFEFAIPRWRSLLASQGVYDPCQAPSVEVRVFSGSFSDAGIGEDRLPDGSATLTLDVLPPGFESCDPRVCRTDFVHCDFTGDVPADFAGDPTIEDSNGDVGNPVSNATGWDLDALYYRYDAERDQASFGLDFVEIAGDADADGDPGGTSQALDDRGGIDEPDLAGKEGIAVAFDLDRDGSIDYLAGVPTGAASIGPGPACEAFDLNDCFALFEADEGMPIGLGNAFGPRVGWPFVQGPKPSAAAPDLEFGIGSWRELMASAGLPFDPCSVPPSVDVRVFAGSFADDGIAEDFLPNGSGFVTLDFPASASVECQLATCEAELDECRASQASDVDRDGVPDRLDRCADTRPETQVDAAGCSHAQFCAGLPADWRVCKAADWNNDEPLGAKDCEFRDYRCVPRGSGPLYSICHHPVGNKYGFHTTRVGWAEGVQHLRTHYLDFVGECCEMPKECDGWSSASCQLRYRGGNSRHADSLCRERAR